MTNNLKNIIYECITSVYFSDPNSTEINDSVSFTTFNIINTSTC